MKKKKIKVLEFIIIFLIILVVITLIFFANYVLKDKVKPSDSNKITNYSKTRYIFYKKDINSISYNIPEKEHINSNNSSYKYYIISTDNAIEAIAEEIKISYFDESNKDNIINFCNDFNEIESTFKFTCEFKENILSLNSNYNLDENRIINTKKKITLDVKKDQALSLYLKELQDKKIEVFEIDK